MQLRGFHWLQNLFSTSCFSHTASTKRRYWRCSNQHSRSPRLLHTWWHSHVLLIRHLIGSTCGTRSSKSGRTSCLTLQSFVTFSWPQPRFLAMLLTPKMHVPYKCVTIQEGYYQVFLVVKDLILGSKHALYYFL